MKILLVFLFLFCLGLIYDRIILIEQLQRTEKMLHTAQRESIHRQQMLVDAHRVWNARLIYELHNHTCFHVSTQMTAREMLWHLEELFQGNTKVRVDLAD